MTTMDKKDLSQLDANADKELSSREIDRFLTEYMWLKWVSIDDFFKDDDDSMMWNKIDKERLEEKIRQKMWEKTESERQEYLEFFSQYVDKKYEKNKRVEKLVSIIKSSLSDLKREIESSPEYKWSASISYADTKYQEISETKEKTNWINDPIIKYLLEAFVTEDAQLAFWEYFEDINVMSALKVIKANNWKTISSKDWDWAAWRKAWYKYDWWVFWPTELSNVKNLKEYYESWENSWLNEKINTLLAWERDWYDVETLLKSYELLKQPGATNDLFKILCDYNLDWTVNSKDQSNITWQMLFDMLNNLEKSVWEKKLIWNIYKVLEGAWVSTKWFENSREWLHKLFLEVPYAMQLFVKQLEIRSSWWLENVRYILETGSLWKSLQVRESVETKLQENEFFKEFRLWVENKYESSLKNLKRSTANISDPQEKAKAQKIVNFLENNENKKWILEAMRLNGIWLLIKLVKKNDGVAWWSSFTNDEINDYLKENTNNIVKSLDLTFGLNYDSKGSILPWVWLHLTFGDKFKGSQDLEWIWWAWVLLIIPYVALWIEKIMNRDEMNKAWLRDFDVPAKSVWASGSIALTFPSPSVWWMLYWTNDWEKWINEKREQFTWVMNNIFDIKDSALDSKSLSEKLKENFEKQDLSDDDKSYISTILANINTWMSVYWYDSLPDNQKKIYIDWIRKAYINSWEQAVINQQSKEWYRFAWAWIGLAFIAWFLPLPLIWIKFQKIEKRYTQDKESEILSSLNLYYWAWQERKDIWTTLDWFAQNLKEHYMDIDWLDIKHENWKLVFTTPEWTDILKKINVNYVPNISSQIQYDQNKLVVGNVWEISLYRERTAKWKKYHLILWSNKIEWTRRIVVWDGSFKDNEPSNISYNDWWEEKFNIESWEYINEDLAKYIKNNIDRIVWLPQRSPSLFKDFKRQLNSRYYESALLSLTKLIESDSNLKSDLSWVLKEMKFLRKVLKDKLDQKVDIYSSNDPQIVDTLNKSMYIVSQFNSAMMVDWQTKDKLLDSSERLEMVNKYISQLYSRYKSLSVKKADLEWSSKSALNDPSKWSIVERKLTTIDSEMMKEAWYPWINDNPAKKLYSLLKPVKWLLNESFMWAQNTNRREAFSRLVTQNWLDSTTMLKYRDWLLDKFWNKSDFMPLEEDKSMLSFTASYKIDSANKSRLSWGFDTMPPGIVSVAWWKDMVQEITDESSKQWIIKNVSWSKYFENMKISLSKYISSKSWKDISLTNQDMENLLTQDVVNVSWHKLSLKKQFVYFLYWMCGNESLWLRFQWIELDWWVSWLAFNADWSMVVQTLRAAADNITIWSAFWEKSWGMWSVWWGGSWGWGVPWSTPWTVGAAPWSSGTSDQ